MSGLINAQPAAKGKASDGGGFDNPLLQQAQDQIEAKLTPENRQDYDKVVVAGLHIALAQGPTSFVAKLSHTADPITACAKGAVQLMLVMRKEAKGVLELQAGIPAGFTLMLHGLAFIERAKLATIGPNELAEATKTFANEMFFRLGISPQMLQHASNRVHDLVQDPDAMAKIQLKAGLTQHPGAATPTPIPGITTPPARS